MIINTKLDLFKYGTTPKKSELTDKELSSFLVASPTKKQHEIALNVGKKILEDKKLEEAKRDKWSKEWMTGGGREKGGRSLDQEIKIAKDLWLAEQRVPKKPEKIKPTEPVKIDFNLPPTHTAGLWSNIKDSSIYKLLDNPKVMGVELSHDGIMEAIHLLQSSGLLKEGGKVK
jgi:hypothetical protein